MVVLLMAALGLIVSAVLAFWPVRDVHAPCPPDSEQPPIQRWVPASLEGVLATQLLAGAITRAQYLRALEQIAARDERRAPFALP